MAAMKVQGGRMVPAGGVSSEQQERDASRIFRAQVSQYWDQTRKAMNDFLRHPGSKGLADARDLAAFMQAQNLMDDLMSRIEQNIIAGR